MMPAAGNVIDKSPPPPPPVFERGGDFNERPRDLEAVAALEGLALLRQYRVPALGSAFVKHDIGSDQPGLVGVPPEFLERQAGLAVPIAVRIVESVIERPGNLAA